VVVYMPNATASVIAIFGILKAGGVFVVVNHTTKQDKLAYILQNSQSAAVLTDPRRFEAVQDAMSGLASLKLVVVAGDASLPEPDSQQVPCLSLASVYLQFKPEQPARSTIDLDLACLIYTSGSTGEPKGVMSDHSNVLFAASSIIEYIGNVEDDIVICLLPLSFDYGLYQLLMTFKFGGTLVLESSFAYPAAILKLMEQQHVTGLPGVPTIFSILLQTDLSPYDLSSLRYLTNTAAALPPSHILQLRDKFPGTRLFSMYGLTETKRTLYLPPAQLDIRPGSVGIPIPGTEAWLEDEDGVRLPPGSTGELVVRGRHVMRGYWNDPVTSAVRFRPGKLPHERLCYTGDLFRTDDEGYFYFVGRKDDIIKSRGEKVAPKEVENVLYMLPGVVEAAVIGVEDPVLGQAVKAFLVVEGVELTDKQVLAHCRAHLEDFMVPKYVEFRNQLEKTSSGKIKKTGLT
jgi:long-chain acyl-CoA synthetase